MKKLSLILICLLELASSGSFAQCEKDISTNPLNPINSEFMQLSNEWYGNNGPYTVNSMLNTWSWFPPANTPFFNLNLTNGWASDLPTTIDLAMNNPFFGVGSPTFIHAQANNYQDRDWKWEDGWELLYMNLGRYPDMTLSTQLTSGSYWGENGVVYFPDPDNVPYFVLYNRYRGTMRVFANVWKTNLVPNSQEFMIQLRFEPSAELNQGLSGILRHAGSYDTPLDHPTSFEKHYSPRQAPTTKTNWMVTDFQMGFDPCICMKEVNDTTQLGKLQFVYTDISTTNIEMTSRSIAVDEEITEAGLMDDFLNMSELNTGDYEPGQRIYTKMEDLYSDYLDRLEKYREELDEQRSDFNFLKAFLGKVAPALTNTFVDGWTYDNVIPKLKEDSVMGAKSDEEVKAELDEARKKYELNFNNNNQFGTKALQSLTKGILGIGFDFLNIELFPKSPAPVKPTAPVATFTETVYKGTISDTSFTPGPQLYQPGGITYGNENDGYWGYGQADLAFTSLPVYNKVLGQAALLTRPQVNLTFHAESSEDTLEYASWPSPLGQYIECELTKEVRSSFAFDLKFEEVIEIAINRSLDFDMERTETYVQVVVVLENELEPFQQWFFSSLDFDQRIENSTYSNMSLENVYREPEKTIIESTTKWISLKELNQMSFHLQFDDIFEYEGHANSQSGFSDDCDLYFPFNISDTEYEIKDIKIKLLHDFHFEQIGSGGVQINTTQIHTYEMYNRDNSLNFIGDPNNWTTEPAGVFDKYITGILTMGNEIITTAHPHVHEVIGNDIYINAQEVQITGPLEVEPGYTLIIQALEQIHQRPDAELNPKIHMRIKKDFYDTPVFEYADNAEVYSFCNTSSAYQANTASKALKARIAEQVNVTEAQNLQVPEKRNTSIAIYPNPASSALTIQSQGNGIDRLTVFDAATRPVIQQTPNGSNLFELDINNLSPGVYIVRADCGDEVLTEKLVVAK